MPIESEAYRDEQDYWPESDSVMDATPSSVPYPKCVYTLCDAGKEAPEVCEECGAGPCCARAA